MHSSISSSDRSVTGAPDWLGGMRGIWVLLGAVLLLLVLVEAAARVGVARLSKIEGLRLAEAREAVALSRAGGRSAALVVGNSLLEAGVDFPRLGEALAGRSIVGKRYVVHNTSYLDWRYGIRRLIAQGARPDAFVVVLSLEQLVGNGFRGAYSAHHLLSLRDVFHVAKELDLGNTETSGLALSRLSAFYGMREEIRKQVLQKLLPEAPYLTAKLAAGTGAAKRPLDEVSVEIAAVRLEVLVREAALAGARLVLVVPPTASASADALVERLTTRVGKAAVLMPVRNAELGAQHYSDGFHLNERGAAVFTAKVADALTGALGRAQPAP